MRQHAGRLLDVGGRDLDVEIVRERLGNQVVEHGVAELLPPLGVGGVGGVLRLEAEGAGRVDGRPRVIRAERARAAPGETGRDDGAVSAGAWTTAPWGRERRGGPSVPPGRPKGLTAPLGASEQSEFGDVSP